MLDRRAGDFRLHAPRAELRHEAALAARAVVETVPHERGGDSCVVEEPLLLEPLEAGIDALGGEPSAPQAAAEVAPRARAARQEGERGLPHPHLRVGVEEALALPGVQRVAGSQTRALERLERDLERIAAVEVGSTRSPRGGRGSRRVIVGAERVVMAAVCGGRGPASMLAGATLSPAARTRARSQGRGRA